LQVLEERLGCVTADRSYDDVMNLVDVADVLGVDPDHRYDVEESSPLVIILGVTEDSLVDVLEKVADYRIEKLLESTVLIFLQTDVN
jgi:hypothetical protein